MLKLLLSQTFNLATQAKRKETEKFKSSFVDERAVASIIFPDYLSTYWDTAYFLGPGDVG